MLNTLIEIGKQVSEGRDPWEDFLLTIKVKEKDAEKEQLMLPVVFNLDTDEVSVGELKRYNTERRRDYGFIDILKGHNKAIYVAVVDKNLDKLAKALFGKESKDGGRPADRGEFQEAIQKDYPHLVESEFYEALSAVQKLSAVFYERFNDEKGKLGLKDVSIGKQSLLVGVYAAVSSAEKGWKEKPLAQIEGYRTFIEEKFLPKAASQEDDRALRLCYATGELKSDVGEANFSARYNLNKIFQATTINYASNFDGKQLRQNYQLSEAVRIFLDRGSEKMLNDYQVRIAGLPHICVPRLPIGSEYDITEYRRLRDKTDLIFRTSDIASVISELEDQANGTIYWLDFYGFESDGNFLKMTNHIQDVSGIHIQNIIRQSKEVSKTLRLLLRDRLVNLAGMYYRIPVRKDLKSNQALELFKMVLEKRPVRASLLWQHFTELVLCHWFGRYEAYDNIDKPRKEGILDALLREAVFSYLAFRQILIKLNLLIMEDNQGMSKREVAIKLAAQVSQFLDDMNYSQEQRAMFFLGKALKRVVSMQRKDGKAKTALDMVNFNGLDERSIRNIATGIMEKGRQYSGQKSFPSKLEGDLDRFFQHFPGGADNWAMDPREALFFFLSGYTHWTPKEGDTTNDENSSN